MDATSPLQQLYDSAISNPHWVNKLMNGDAGARSLFDSMTRAMVGLGPTPPPASAAQELSSPDTGGTHDLFAPDAAERLPIVSAIGDPYAMSDRQKLDLVNTLRQSGMSEGTIREAFDDSRTYTAELREMAQQKWQDLSSDPDFRQRLLSGDPVAARQWRAHAIIMSGGVKG
jgi:hypothetical protein